MTRKDFSAFVMPFLIGAVMLCFTTCGHAQPLPPATDWSYKSTLDWKVPTTDTNTVSRTLTFRIPTKLAIEASDNLRDWSYCAQAVVVYTTTNDRSVRFFRVSEAPQVKTIAWDASPDWWVAGYRLHFGPEAGQSSSSVGVGTNLTAQVVASDIFTAVTAVDDAGVESDFSGWIKL